MHRNCVLLAAAGFAFLGVAPPHARQAQQQPEPTQVIQLSTKLSAEIPATFRSLQSDETPPPGALAPYAPPFHFSQVLMLANAAQNSVLLLGLSDNPLMGHDGYWLDAQMHAPSGSGMSMLDLLFYFFFPPSHACMDDALQNYTTATMTPDTPDSTPLIQVSYKCPPGHALRLLFGTGKYRNHVSADERRAARVWRDPRFLFGAHGTSGHFRHDLLYFRSATAGSNRSRGHWSLPLAGKSAGRQGRFFLGYRGSEPVSICR